MITRTRCQFLRNRSLPLLQVLVDFSDGVLRGTFSPWAEWRASVPNFVQISHWHVKHVNTLHIFSGNQGQSSRYTWLTNQRHWRRPKRQKIQKPHETTWNPKLFTISRPRYIGLCDCNVLRSSKELGRSSDVSWIDWCTVHGSHVVRLAVLFSFGWVFVLVDLFEHADGPWNNYTVWRYE